MACWLMKLPQEWRNTKTTAGFVKCVCEWAVGNTKDTWTGSPGLLELDGLDILSYHFLLNQCPLLTFPRWRHRPIHWNWMWFIFIKAFNSARFSESKLDNSIINQSIKPGSHSQRDLLVLLKHNNPVFWGSTGSAVQYIMGGTLHNEKEGAVLCVNLSWLLWFPITNKKAGGIYGRFL